MRGFASTSQCLWVYLTSHWLEPAGGTLDGSGCGRCDNCRFRAQTAEDEGARSRDFGQVGVLVAMMVEAAAHTSRRRGKVTEREFLATNKRGDVTFSAIAQLKKAVDAGWRTSVGARQSAVWTQPRLYLFLNTLCELGSPWVRRELWRVPANAGAPPGTTHVRTEFELTPEGRAALRTYDAGGAVSLCLPVPLFLRQLEGGFDGHGPSDDEGAGDEELPDDDDYVEDRLGLGQKVLVKDGVPCYMVSCVVDERVLSKGLEYCVSWQKHEDTTWVRATRYAVPASAHPFAADAPPPTETRVPPAGPLHACPTCSGPPLAGC